MNAQIRRQRRRLVVAALLVGLAGATVLAHSAMAGEHMAEGVAMCVAVAETALVAVGVAVGLGAGASSRPLPHLAFPGVGQCPALTGSPPPAARAGPSITQVFRL